MTHAPSKWRKMTHFPRTPPQSFHADVPRRALRVCRRHKKLDPAGRGLDHSYLWTIPTSGFLSFCGIPTLEFTLTSVLIVVWFIPWIFEHPCCETSLPLKCSTLSVRVFYSFANKCYELHASIFFRQLLGAVIRRIRVVAHGIRLHVAGMIALVMG